MSPHELTMVVRDTGIGAGEAGANAGTTVTVSVPIARAAWRRSCSSGSSRSSPRANCSGASRHQ
jgi:hypothetical protein